QSFDEGGLIDETPNQGIRFLRLDVGVAAREVEGVVGDVAVPGVGDVGAAALLHEQFLEGAFANVVRVGGAQAQVIVHLDVQARLPYHELSSARVVRPA